MTRLKWDAPGERIYEYGVDRCVLYTKSGKTAPWNGIKNIDQNPTGAEVSTFYIDGEKVNQSIENEEFEAVITAFTAPKEFDECDGTVDLGKGLFVDAQPRSMFDLSWRTMIGNDVDGPDGGYKLHLLYNCLATPSPKKNETVGQDITPQDFVWNVSTFPITFPGQKASAHYVIDTRGMDKFILRRIEDILYGTAFTAPRMPTAKELKEFFRTAVTVTITDNGDGTWTASGPDEVIKYLTATEFQITWGSAKFLDAFTYTLQTL